MNDSGGKVYKKSGLIGLYTRKLFFFVSLFVIGVGYYATLQANRTGADQASNLSEFNSSGQNIAIEVKPKGELIINGQESGKRVVFLKDFDEIRMPVIDKPGVNYDAATITVTFPDSFASKVNHEILAIHGVGSSQSYVKDSRSIVYSAQDVSSYATVSIAAEIPKGYIDPGFVARVGLAISSLQVNVWLVFGILLPTLTFVFVLLFVAYESRRQRVDVPDQEITSPPMAIPPALAGVLIHQKVRPREIAATLIDLAVRGDIVILDRERGFTFGKHKLDQRLLGYEKILLSKIFRDSLSSDRAEIEQRINNHFYSKKISIVSAGIYALATRLGYFRINPQRVHAKYRLIGIGIFILGLIGFCLNIFIFTDPPFMVFFWLGMMISALIVAFGAGRIPFRTPIGQENLSNWLAFKKFLSNPEPFPYETNGNEIFQRYLPYAMVLDCEAVWAKRFSRHVFATPGWFLSDKTGLSLEDFCLSLFPIISYVSRSLSSLREPGFE